jgi:protein gp37
MALAKRLKAMGSAKYQNDGDPRTSGPGFGVTVHPDSLEVPLRWRKPKRVFVNSMSDLYHARVPVSFIAQVFITMARTPQHTYQILTKRPERQLAIVGDDLDGGYRLLEETINEDEARALYDRWPLPNVHLGTSIELDRYTRRADDLRQTSAAVRFLSLEPLLGPLPSLDLTGIDWCIIGGESGPDAREMDLGWARELLAQCRDAGVAPFIKQLGSVWARDNGGGKGGDWERWPADLMVREFPADAEVITV